MSLDMLIRNMERYAYPVGTLVTYNEDEPNNQCAQHLILGVVEGYNSNGQCLFIKFLESSDPSWVGQHEYYFPWRVKPVTHIGSTCKMNFKFE